jgi:hypothetical protein
MGDKRFLEHDLMFVFSVLEGPTLESREMAQQTEIQLALDWAVVDCCLHDLPESVQNPSLLFTFERRSTFKIRVWLGALFALASVSYAFLVRCSPCNLLILFGFGSRLVRCRGVPLNFARPGPPCLKPSSLPISTSCLSLVLVAG